MSLDDIIDLIGIAASYNVPDLVNKCELYIGHHALERGWEADWEIFGKIGVLYKSQFLCQLSNYYRLRLGQPLSSRMRKDFEELGIFPLPQCSQNIVVKCDVGPGSRLGVYRQFKEGRDVFRVLEWSPEGWIGNVPISTWFYFVCIQPDKSFIVEQRQDTRCLLETKEECLEIGDVTFPK
jgi:hypothetical protein